ncbi:MAG: hypothetical protein E4G99_05130 [Anaerolineales bacterium]|nr:MAG: hypothetical protein E4G99_05130 [Anaerolineales bacterium]
MVKRALFEGLVIDEYEQPVSVTQVGGDAFYVVNDDGFLRHIESELVDRQVLEEMAGMIEGHEEVISENAMKMLGQEDIFTKASIEASLKNVDQQFATLLQSGLPEETRAWMGMTGFQVVIDIHGQLIRLEQPAASASEDE